jgi:hypothetical protein
MLDRLRRDEDAAKVGAVLAAAVEVAAAGRDQPIAACQWLP